MRKIIASVLAGIMLYPLPTLAAGRVPSRSETVRSVIEISDALAAAGIGPGAEVSVTLRDRSVVTGRVDYVGTHSLFLVDSTAGSVTQVPYRNLSQLQAWSPGKTKIVLAVVAVVAAVIVIRIIDQWAGAN